MDGDRPGDRGEIEVITSEIETECLSREVSFMHTDWSVADRHGQTARRQRHRAAHVCTRSQAPSGRVQPGVLWFIHAAEAECVKRFVSVSSITHERFPVIGSLKQYV